MSMMRFAQLCLGVVGIPFLIVGISYIIDNQKLPVDSLEQACVYEIVQSGSSVFGRKGIGSYWKDDIRVSAYHVVQDCAGDCRLDMSYGDGYKKSVLLRAIRRIGTSDIALFQVNGSYRCITPAMQSTILSVVSGQLVRYPVAISGNSISLETYYGQSGSPVYQDNELVGVVSQRAQGFSFIEILP